MVHAQLIPRLDGGVSTKLSAADIKEVRKEPFVFNKEHWRMIFPGQSGYITVVDDE